ncbi:MAG: hypothetical protein ACI87E_003399 [Mariniblastus sp.]|jgi:hypothetical protein
MNDLENYKAIVDQYFGPATARFDTASDVSNPIIEALNRTDFAPFRSVFLKRCERLAACYPASAPNYEPLKDRLNEMASPGKWDGVYAEMVAFDFLNSDRDWLSGPIELSRTVPAAETLTSEQGRQNANFDGYYDDFDVCFDVKVLGDKSGAILDGIISQVTGNLGISGMAVSPEYPLDLGFDKLQTNRNELCAELEAAINIGERTPLVRSRVVGELTYRIKWDSGVLMTANTYDPFKHAADHHTLLFKHTKKFSRNSPSLIVFVVFPWFSERVVTASFSSDVFYRSFCRRFFCQYANDNRPASSMVESFNGNETVAQVTDKLSGVLFLEDTSIKSSNTDELNVEGFAYLNPNAAKKVGGHFREHLSSLGVFVDDFEHDNY